MADPISKVSQLTSLSLVKEKHVDAFHVSQVATLTLVVLSPDFRWIDMFVDEVFPYDISFNSVGTTTFQTDVTVVSNGYDQRVAQWTQPLMQYDISYGVRTMEDLHGLIAFFRAMQGKKNGFLYYDHMDHSSTLATSLEARKAPAISPTDQLIGTGDGATTQFQLIKTYPTPGNHTSVRPIYKPNAETVQIALNGKPINTFSVDASTGIITLYSPLSFLNIPAATLSKAPYSPWRVTADANRFNGLTAGARVQMSGWTNTVNNTTATTELRVSSVAADGSWFEFSSPSGFGLAEGPTAGVSVSVYPAPDVGVKITAGYEFFVPVRFDTDTLPTSLQEYGVGNASNVKLIELRKSDI